MGDTSVGVRALEERERASKAAWEKARAELKAEREKAKARAMVQAGDRRFVRLTQIDAVRQYFADDPERAARMTTREWDDELYAGGLRRKQRRHSLNRTVREVKAERRQR